jgi:hypothetical protein
MFVQSSEKLTFVGFFFTISIQLGDVYPPRFIQFHRNFLIFVIIGQLIHD